MTRTEIMAGRGGGKWTDRRISVSPSRHHLISLDGVKKELSVRKELRLSLQTWSMVVNFTKEEETTRNTRRETSVEGK